MYVIRSIRRHLVAYSLVAVVMAIAFGMTVVFFATVEGTIVRPLPVSSIDRILHIGGLGRPQAIDPVAFWRSQISSLEELALYETGSVALAHPWRPAVQASAVSPSFFNVFEVRPRAGRLFAPSDASPDQPVAVISHDFWHANYQEDPGVIGNSIILANSPYTIVGVAPRGFNFPAGVDLWIVSSFRGVPAHPLRQANGSAWIGRLASESSFDQARAEIRAALPRADAIYRARTESRLGEMVFVYPIRSTIIRRATLLLQMLAIGVLAILLIAVTTASLVLLSTALTRANEISIKLALGARPRHILWPFILEAGCISTFALVSGFVLAQYGFAWIQGQLQLYGVYSAAAVSSGFVLTLSIFTAACVAAAIGIIPALQVYGFSTSAGIGARLDRSTRSRSSTRVRKAIVVMHVALSSMLILVSQLALSNAMRSHAANREFNTDSLIALELDLQSLKKEQTAEGASDGESSQDAGDEVHKLLNMETTAVALGGISELPLPHRRFRKLYLWHEANSVGAEYLVATPLYFDMIGIPIKYGREFKPADRQAVILNTSLARALCGTESPIGDHVRIADEEIIREVVGVVPDLGMHLFKHDHPYQFYLPYDSPFKAAKPESMTMVARCRTELNRCLSELDRGVNPGMVRNVASFDAIMAKAEAPERARALLFGSFAAVALVLVFIGVYGAISYLTSTRQFEMAVRSAMGAGPWDVVEAVAGEIVVCSAGGLAAGSLAALLLSLLGSKLLFDFSSLTAAGYAASTAIVLGAVVLAAVWPASRFARSLRLESLSRSE